MIQVRILGAAEADQLAEVAPDVFDHAVDPRWTAEFFADPRHHLAAAIDRGTVVGMASAVHYVHPDKPPELWIDEVGVAPTHEGQGLGKRLLAALLELGRELGCVAAWVLADQSNERAHRLYRSAGGEAAPEPAIMFTFRLDEPQA